MKRGAIAFFALFGILLISYTWKDNLNSLEKQQVVGAAALQYPVANARAEVSFASAPTNSRAAEDSTKLIYLAIKNGTWDAINGSDILAALQSDASLKEAFYRSVHNKPTAQIIKAQQIVFQMGNADRELFANILLESPNAEARVYGYEILASANMEATGINPLHLNRVIDAMYFETDPLVVSGILSTMATRFIEDENLPRFKARALELARSENKEIRYSATLALIKFTEDPSEDVKKLIRNQLASGDNDIRGALLSELHTVSVADPELIAQIEKILVDPITPSEIKAEASAVLQHWRLTNNSRAIN